MKTLTFAFMTTLTFARIPGRPLAGTVRHSRGGGNPELSDALDSRLRGNDDPNLRGDDGPNLRGNDGPNFRGDDGPNASRPKPSRFMTALTFTDDGFVLR